jgi:hypothetical protein
MGFAYERASESTGEAAHSTSSTPVEPTALPPASTNRPGEILSSVKPLVCSPKTFGPNDTLTLRMKVPHGDYLIADVPGGDLFYIVYPKLGDSTRKESILPSDAFKTMPMIRMPGDMKAKHWRYGHDTTEVLFGRPGKYVLWLGVNLEGDFNAHSDKCEVTFTGSHKE